MHNCQNDIRKTPKYTAALNTDPAKLIPFIPCTFQAQAPSFYQVTNNNIPLRNMVPFFQTPTNPNPTIEESYPPAYTPFCVHTTNKCQGLKSQCRYQSMSFSIIMTLSPLSPVNIGHIGNITSISTDFIGLILYRLPKKSIQYCRYMLESANF